MNLFLDVVISQTNKIGGIFVIIIVEMLLIFRYPVMTIVSYLNHMVYLLAMSSWENQQLQEVILSSLLPI